MSWVKIDDVLPDNLKVASLSDAAFRAYIESICYAASALSDGLVPDAIARKRGWTKRRAELVKAGLWEPATGGHVIHDYLEYNPTREQALKREEDRHAGKVAGGKARAAQAQREGGKFTSSAPAEPPAGDQQETSSATSRAPAPSPSRPEDPDLNLRTTTSRAGAKDPSGDVEASPGEPEPEVDLDRYRVVNPRHEERLREREAKRAAAAGGEVDR